MKLLKKLLSIGVLFVFTSCNINEIFGELTGKEEISNKKVEEGEVTYETFHKQVMLAGESPYKQATLRLHHCERIVSSTGQDTIIDASEKAEFTLKNGIWETDYINKSDNPSENWLQTFKDYIVSNAKTVAQSSHPESKYYIEKYGFRYDMVSDDNYYNSQLGITMHLEGTTMSRYNEYAQLVEREFELTLTYNYNGADIIDITQGEYSATFIR